VGGGAGKVNCRDIGLSNAFDASSTALFQGVTTGKHFAKAELDFVRTGGERSGTSPFLKYELQDVLVTSLSNSGAAGGSDNVPDENLALNFSKITVSYYTQDGKGSTKLLNSASWNCVANTTN
jgi:type VI secretion system secreted protein Hcp